MYTRTGFPTCSPAIECLQEALQALSNGLVPKSLVYDVLFPCDPDQFAVDGAEWRYHHVVIIPTSISLNKDDRFNSIVEGQVVQGAPVGITHVSICIRSMGQLVDISPNKQTQTDQ